MSNKERYAQWIERQSSLPIMMQPWWMDAVCAGKQWDVLLVTDSILSDGADKSERSDESATAERLANIVAAMPYLIRERWWMRYIIMPMLTQHGGVWLDEHRSWSEEEISIVCAEIATHLNGMGLHYYYQQYPVGSPLPQAMVLQGFTVKERITYRLPDLSDLDKVIDRFAKNKKRQLQKALSLHAEYGWTAEEFYQFNQTCRAQQKRKVSYSREFLLVLEQKARKHRCSQIITIRNADKEVYAAAWLVWDKERMYYIVPVYSQTHKDSGAGALLVLESLKFAREKGVIFDFEGSMDKGIANHYKQFGSAPTLYHSVEKYYKWWFRIPLWFNRWKSK